MGITLPYAYLQDLEAEIMQSMASYLARVTAAGLAGATVVVHGVPFHEILETAKTQLVDLIIMGTHGRTGLQHVLLGSVAEKVVRLAPCPVLVARQPTLCQYCKGRIVMPFTHVLVPTDFSQLPLCHPPLPCTAPNSSLR